MDDKEPAVSLTSCSYSMYPNPLGFPALLVTSRISLILPCCNNKNALYLSVNVFSTKAVIENTISITPSGDGARAILRGHPSHAQVQPFARQR